MLLSITKYGTLNQSNAVLTFLSAIATKHYKLWTPIQPITVLTILSAIATILSITNYGALIQRNTVLTFLTATGTERGPRQTGQCRERGRIAPVTIDTVLPIDMSPE